MSCPICFENNPQNFYKKSGRKGYHTYCKKCFNQRCLLRQREKKQKAVEYLGGCCERCGYKKCLRALQFHHLKPELKSDFWATMRGWGWSKLEKELEHCQLLCSNCHAEVEDALVSGSERRSSKPF